MSYMPPAGADRRLPRSHLLVLNRSFRRTLEAENKSPRTMQAPTPTRPAPRHLPATQNSSTSRRLRLGADFVQRYGRGRLGNQHGR
jgi:hypothetical protein